MIHSFDTDIAKAYGVNAAIILNNLYFWIEKNRANEENIHDGIVWTYNSSKAFSTLFPYFTERQIRYALDKLRDEGIVVTGNYNKNPYDKTLWYGITKKGYSILQKSQSDMTKLSNRSDGIVEPVPDIKPNDKTTNIKPNIKQKENATACQSDDIKTEFNNLWSLYPKKQGKERAMNAYKKARKGCPELYAIVENGIKRYSDYIAATQTDIQFVKQGGTWFYQHCWEDDYTIRGNSNGQFAKHDGQDSGKKSDSYENYVMGIDL